MFRKPLLKKALVLGFAAFAFAQPALADDVPLDVEAQVEKIGAMPLKELDVFLTTISAAVNKDSLQMRGLAQSSACLELTRAANSFALGYTYLAAVRDTAAKLADKAAPIVRARAIQVRVTTFAARVRAEEWLAQRCRNFAAPAEQAGDPRYVTPAKVSNAEYTDAVIEARQAAETNLAIAVAAGLSGRCPEAIVAGQNIALLMPYIQRLLADTAKKPQVLGPRASRRGLEVSRQQLLAALDKLQAEFGEKCKAPAPAPQPAE